MGFGHGGGLVRLFRSGGQGARGTGGVCYGYRLRERVAESEYRLAHWPEEADVPVPSEGWYTVELGGEQVDIFRDEYGVPHVYAQSIEGAYRGQGYVQMEDRTVQILASLAEVRGISASYKGAEGIGHDKHIRTRG